MQVTFASNQILTSDGGASVIYTEPLALGNDDRVSGVVNVHYIYGTGPDLYIKTQVSNDGIYWVDQGIDTASAPYGPIVIEGTGATRLPAATVLGAFVRVAMQFNATAGAIGFDFHATLDHA